MKSLLCTLSILITMLHYSSTMNMDSDKEYGIPLDDLPAIYDKRKINTSIQKPADEQFTEFEQKIDKEYHSAFLRVKEPHLETYFQRAQQEVPAIIADDETVKKFSLTKKSFYKEAIEDLIEQTQSHYKNVTCETLPIINNPQVLQSSSFLNKLPFCIRKHVMERAYQEIDSKHPVITFEENIDSVSVRGKGHIAATAHNSSGIFRICDLKTRIIYALPKKSIHGDVFLSCDGSQLLTTTIAQKEPLIVDLDIWNCQTRQNTHTIHHRYQLALVRLINQDDNTSKLIIIDNTSNLLIYIIKTDSIPLLSEDINLNMPFSHSSNVNNSLAGEYSRDGNTLYKDCTAFYLCSRAIKNTQNKDSLSIIKTAMLYLSLTPCEKESINQKIAEREAILAKQEGQQNIFLSWFGS